MSTIERTWTHLRATSEWDEWARHVPDREDLFTSVFFEERDRPRHLVKAHSLTYYVPSSQIHAAEEMRSLESFAADVRGGHPGRASGCSERMTSRTVPEITPAEARFWSDRVRKVRRIGAALTG
jgi:hypothetical protein